MAEYLVALNVKFSENTAIGNKTDTDEVSMELGRIGDLKDALVHYVFQVSVHYLQPHCRLFANEILQAYHLCHMKS